MKLGKASIALIGVGAFVLLAAIAVVALNRDDDMQRASDGVAPQASDAELVARGEYLVRAGSCYGCHTEPGGAPYAGGRAIETPFGIVNAPNLTADATGLAGWSSDDFWRALHNGRSRDGHLLYPAFPYPNYTRLARADADAMFAYLKSVAPVAKQNRPHALRFPFDQPVALALWRALFFRPARFDADSAKSPQWNRGAYLVETLGHCNACHSRRNVFGATAGPLDLAGGLIPIQNWYAPSLKDNAEAGVGDWPEREVVALLKSGVSARGSVQGPMAEVVARSTQFLSEDDLEAMAAYLASLPDGPDASRRASRDGDTAAVPSEAGAKLYTTHCAACHGDRGQTRGANFPDLTRTPFLHSQEGFDDVVLKGVRAEKGMASFANVLKPEDTVAIRAYLTQRANELKNAPPPGGPPPPRTGNQHEQ